MKLKLKVVPNASNNIIVGWLGESLKVKVVAAPEKGKANKAVIKLLSDALNIDKKNITINTGATSAIKIVSLNGVCKPHIQACLGKPQTDEL